jgi:hypothetical protein
LIEIDKEEFRRRFPHLAREIEEGSMKISIDAVRTSKEEAEKAALGSRDYMPTAVDYLRRCDNDEQASETINYLEGKGEITGEYAKKLRRQLKKMGVRSFGPKKE